MSDTDEFGVCPRNESIGVSQSEKHQSATRAEDICNNQAHDTEKQQSLTVSEENTLAGVTNSTPDDSPKAGLLAYLIVPASFFIWFNSWGAINGFGVFQTHYQLSLLSNYSPSTIAWIGSVQNWLILFVGFLSGPLYDAGYAPILVCGGALLTVIGKMMLSLASDGAYYQVFLAQGVCVGLGWGLMFTPAASMPGRFWKGQQLGLATGVASAGASVGGVVYSVTFNQLLQSSGVEFPWATRSLGFLAFATLALSCIIISIAGRQKPPAHRQFIDWTAFKELRFNAYLIGGIFTMAGVQAPYYYANLYAIDKGMTSTEVGFYVITAINAGSFFGRLTPPFVAMRIGVFNTFILCYVATFAACFSFIAARSASGIFVVAILYGFFSGAVVTLSPITIIQMTPDPMLIGTRMGMAFAIPSFGVLVGCPIFGEIFSATKSYTYIWVLSGLSIALGAVFMVVCRVAQSGWNLVKKV